jgi:hypothetical protein
VRITATLNANEAPDILIACASKGRPQVELPDIASVLRMQ